MKINLNDLAKEITLQEGKKRSLPIGQVKEVLKITLLKLKEFPIDDVIKLFKRIK
jgi:hypothetical protein